LLVFLSQSSAQVLKHVILCLHFKNKSSEQEKQIKTTEGYHSISTRMAIIKKTTASVGKDMETLECSCTADRNVERIPVIPQIVEQ
jgi:hypothetical protein